MTGASLPLISRTTEVALVKPFTVALGLTVKETVTCPFSACAEKPLARVKAA